MDETYLVEKLQQAALSPTQQQQLFRLIETLFKKAINARSPRNRPPGKAGLRAEKGYYRLLYLEENVQASTRTHENIDPHGQTANGEPVTAILRQLADIPELRSEILAGVEAALAEVTNRPPED